jgi:protein-serine/threonine kinase
VLGKGSYGKVMLVKMADRPGEIYAMKMLRKEHIVKRNQVEHTKSERNVLEAVEHPFIVKLHYAFQTPKKLYVVLEFCAGGELFFSLESSW